MKTFPAFNDMNFGYDRFRFLKKFIISMGFLIYTSAIFSNNTVTYKKIHSYYTKGKYEDALKFCRQHIKRSKKTKYDFRIINIYANTENNIRALDKVMEEIYLHSNLNKKKMSLWMYILLDKALISGQYSIGFKWGRRFKKYARRSRLYFKGIYLIACLRYSNKASNLLTLNRILTRKLSRKTKEKLTLLKIGQLRNDDQIIWEANSFLKRYYSKSKFSDFIFYKMIQSYKNKKRSQKVKKLKAIFLRDFPNSIFTNRIAKL